MDIIFYKSVLCPRCALAGKHLKALQAAYPNLRIEEVEILTSPLRAWREGVRMVPALKSGKRILSGVLLHKKAIIDFVMQKSDVD
jgi:hypothetical protein